MRQALGTPNPSPRLPRVRAKTLLRGRVSWGPGPMDFATVEARGPNVASTCPLSPPPSRTLRISVVLIWRGVMSAFYITKPFHPIPGAPPHCHPNALTSSLSPSSNLKFYVLTQNLSSTLNLSKPDESWHCLAFADFAGFCVCCRCFLSIALNAPTLSPKSSARVSAIQTMGI